MKRKFLLALLLVVGVCLGITSTILAYNGLLRSFHPTSKLRPFETRIESVEEEFMRRSPELRTNFTRFEKCIPEKGCILNKILMERNLIIRKRWSELFDRLTVSDDWGEGEYTKEHHSRFQKDLQKAGGQEKAKYCFPKIHYYQLKDGVPIYIYQGLRCP